MSLARAALLALFCACACAPAVTAQATQQAETKTSYDQLFERVEALDTNSHEAVASTFGVTFTLRYQTVYLKYWTAEVPASDSSPHLFLDYRERMPDYPGLNFLAITFPEPSYTLAAAERRYPGMALLSPPGHSADSEWSYEVPSGSNRIGLGFDAQLRHLEVMSVHTRP